MGKVYGYVRVSTVKQSKERQIDNIKSIYPNAIFVTDEYTGKTLDRPNWPKLYKAAKAGDVIVFDEVSRMSRDAAEGFRVYKELFERGVTLVFIKEPQINTDTYKAARDKQIEAVKTGDDIMDEMTEGMMEVINRFILRLAERQIKFAFERSEGEIKFHGQRTAEGIGERKRRNAELEVLFPETYKEHPDYRRIGNESNVKLTTKKSIAAKAKIRELSKDFGGTLDDADVIKLAGVSRNTYYKYKAELKAERAGGRIIKVEPKVTPTETKTFIVEPKVTPTETKTFKIKRGE